jgi:hypothetical protein
LHHERNGVADVARLKAQLLEKWLMLDSAEREPAEEYLARMNLSGDN